MRYLYILCVSILLVLSLSNIYEKTSETESIEFENDIFKKDLLESIYSFSSDTLELYIPEFLK